MTRGPDYAYHLTDEQERTLADLRARVSTVDSGGRWRRRGRVVGVITAAAAVVAVATATALIPTLHAGAPPRPAGPAPVVTSPTTVAGALDALRRAAAADTSTLSPSTEVRTFVVGYRKQTRCTALAYTVTTAVRAASAVPLPGLALTITRVAPPDGTWDQLDCPSLGPTVVPTPTGLFAGDVGTSAEGWTGIAAKLGLQGAVIPALDDPRTVGPDASVVVLSPEPARLAVLLDRAASVRPGGPGAWWAALAQLIGSTLCPPSVRAAALGLAAGPAHLDGVELLVAGPDLWGRTGVTLRVPYRLDDQITTADLTFDPATGRLWQRVITAPAGQFWLRTVTAYP